MLTPWRRERHDRTATSRSTAFGDAVRPLEEMIAMLRAYGPRTVLPGLESMLDVCQVASADPTSVDEAAERIGRTRRAINRPLTDLVVNGEIREELVARNEKWRELEQQLWAALKRATTTNR